METVSESLKQNKLSNEYPTNSTIHEQIMARGYYNWEEVYRDRIEMKEQNTQSNEYPINCIINVINPINKVMLLSGCVGEVDVPISIYSVITKPFPE